MNYNEQKKFIEACTEFLHSCYASGVDGSLSIHKSNIKLLIQPKQGFADYFEFWFDYTLQDNLKKLEVAILLVIETHFKIEKV